MSGKTYAGFGLYKKLNTVVNGTEKTIFPAGWQKRGNKTVLLFISPPFS